MSAGQELYSTVLSAGQEIMYSRLVRHNCLLVRNHVLLLSRTIVRVSDTIVCRSLTSVDQKLLSAGHELFLLVGNYRLLGGGQELCWQC